MYYWSPEWHGEGMWKAFALFDPAGKAKPAWIAFPENSWKGRPLKQPVYFEARSNQLFAVPVQETRAQTVPLVRRLREQTGGVTVEHIALLTNTELKVGAYRVNLKASLQQNLSLELLADRPGIPLAGTSGLENIAAGIKPATERIVLFVRGAPTPETERAAAFFSQRGLQVDVHPKPDDAPLKFGMCGAFAD